MAQTECGHGHIYDTDLYAACPYCNKNSHMIDFTQETMGGGAGYGGGSYIPPTSMGSGRSVMDSGVTVGPGYMGSSYHSYGETPVDEAGTTQPPKSYQARVETAVTDDGAKTIGMAQKKLGFDPVVGWLVCIEGKNKGKDYRLLSKINTIGRSKNMDITIEGDDTISKENHARLAYEPRNDMFHLIPAMNANNIYVNEEVLYERQLLAPYDVIEIGETKLLFIPLCGQRFTWKKNVATTEEA